MSKKILIILVILIITLLLFLFSYTPGEMKEEFKIIDEDGIPVAVNPGHPVPAKNTPEDIVFTEELTVGAAEEDPHLRLKVVYAVGESFTQLMKMKMDICS